MKKDKIPLLELETFTQDYYNIPVLPVVHDELHQNLFTVKNRAAYPAIDYISPNRRKFYKILHITSGSAILTVGLHHYTITEPVITFIHPDEIISWQVTSENGGGHFCLIHPSYFEQFPALTELFRKYPHFKASNSVIQLNEKESLKINSHFEDIVTEDQSQNPDKNESIILLLQMILLEAKRAGKKMPDTPVTENYRYVHSFLNLLESTFRINNLNDVVKLKTATEFASRLHLHANYLNTLVKQQTGKTLREHIQERLLYEAKVLLVHTDWDINAISSSLGFSEHAGFSNFFHKKTGTPPSTFRDTAGTTAHL